MLCVCPALQAQGRQHNVIAEDDNAHRHDNHTSISQELQNAHHNCREEPGNCRNEPHAEGDGARVALLAKSCLDGQPGLVDHGIRCAPACCDDAEQAVGTSHRVGHGPWLHGRIIWISLQLQCVEQTCHDPREVVACVHADRGAPSDVRSLTIPQDREVQHANVEHQITEPGAADAMQEAKLLEARLRLPTSPDLGRSHIPECGPTVDLEQSETLHAHVDDHRKHVWSKDQ
mmetsp:Transcript_62167/g.200413  ORF Transcript_62167/g.200413 Transcript_62167/m.200413 type:complete len:231 (-) Transcript_62167:358-1050(-)